MSWLKSVFICYTGYSVLYWAILLIWKQIPFNSEKFCCIITLIFSFSLDLLDESLILLYFLFSFLFVFLFYFLFHEHSFFPWHSILVLWMHYLLKNFCLRISGFFSYLVLLAFSFPKAQFSVNFNLLTQS